MFDKFNNSFVSSDCCSCFCLDGCVVMIVYHDYTWLADIEICSYVGWELVTKAPMDPA